MIEQGDNAESYGEHTRARDIETDLPPSRVFFALANGDRLAILETLNKETGRRVGLSIGEIAQRASLSRFSASRHLRILKEAGLVTSAKEGNVQFHGLDPRGLEMVEDWLVLIAEPPSSLGRR